MATATERGRDARQAVQAQVDEIIADSAKIRALLVRGEEGDETAVPLLRAIYDRSPDLRDLMGGDPSRRVEDAWIGRVVGDGNLTRAEALRARLRAMRADLAGPSAPPTVRTCAERCTSLWLAVQVIELRRAVAGTASVAELAYWDKAGLIASRKLNEALRTLELVRRLTRPRQPRQPRQSPAVNVAVALALAGLPPLPDAGPAPQLITNQGEQ